MRKLILVTSASCAPCRFLKRTFWDTEIVPNTTPDEAEHVPVEGNFSRVKHLQVKHAPCILQVTEDGVKTRFYGSDHPTAKDLIRWVKGEIR